VNAHTLFKNGKSYLVFDNQLGLHPNLFSSGFSVLSQNGVAQAFTGVTHTNFNQARNRGDIVEKRDNQHLITTPHRNSTQLAPKPSSILIVDKGKTSAKSDEEKKQQLTQLVSSYLKGTAPLLPFPKYTDLVHELRKDIPITISSEINLN